MYLLEKFGSLTLPPYNASATLSPLSAKLAFVETITGAFDQDGFQRSKLVLPLPLRYQAVVLEDDIADTRTALDALRAMVGVRHNLYRRVRSNNSLQSCVARLAAMPYEGTAQDKAWRTITLEFQQLSNWRGAIQGVGWQFDTGVVFDTDRDFDEEPGTTLDANPKTITVANGGNLPTTNVQIIFTTGPAVDQLIITSSKIEIIIDDIPAASGVTIDSGAMQITRNGVDFYSNFSLGPGHQLESWLELAAGNTALTFSRTGGDLNAIATIIFYDTWA